MKYIGVAGQAQQGKDTLADYLRVVLNERRCENYWHRTAFAKAVKQIFMDTFSKDAYYVEKWKTSQEKPPDLDLTVRKALQFIGDGFRQIKSSIWIDLMFRDKQFPKIISDVRYVNELRAIKNHNGFVILVVNPDKVNEDPNGSEAQMRPFAIYALFLADYTGQRQFIGDISVEPHLNAPSKPDGWEFVDYVIINDSTIQDFYARIDEHIVLQVESFFEETA